MRLDVTLKRSVSEVMLTPEASERREGEWVKMRLGEKKGG